VGSGSIGVETLEDSAHVAKLAFVFDEETRSNDFHERSTSWIIFKQYGSNVSIPIGRADPDWLMIGTNNVTIWHWKLEKTLPMEYQSHGNQFFSFPFESFSVDFYVASNISRQFSVSTSISSFSASVNQHDENYNQSSCPYQPEGCSILTHISVSLSHNSEYQIIVGMLYTIEFIIIAIAVVLLMKMGDVDLNFFTISSTILVFVPVLFFAFRDIAPSYLTLFDAVCLGSAIFYGSLILGKLIYRKQPNSETSSNEKGGKLGEPESKVAETTIKKDRRQKTENAEDKELAELVRKVDRNFEKRPWKLIVRDIALVSPFVIMFAVVGYLLFAIAEVISSNFSQLATESQFTLLLAEIVALIAFAELAINLPKAASSERSYKQLVDYNYKKMSAKENGNNRLLLKALILMKSSQPEFSLKDYFDQRKEALNRSSLLERLYQ
jgi:hypothetical protein